MSRAPGVVPARCLFFPASAVWIMQNSDSESNDPELFSRQFPVEQKMFYVDLKANANGMYLKISEKSGGRRHNVLVPASGLRELAEALTAALAIADERSGAR